MLFAKKPDDEFAHDQAANSKFSSPANASPKARVGQTRSVIDPGLLITGILEGDGELQIDGQVRGDIRCTHLTVGSAATVAGNITADEVVVRGKVTGIIGGNRVMLMDSAQVESEIFHKRLSIEEGAHFEGEARFNEQPIEKARSRPQEKSAAEAEARREEEAARRAGGRAEPTPQRAPAARRDEQPTVKANGHSHEDEGLNGAAQGNAEADFGGIVAASPPTAAPARQTPARSARARAKAADPDGAPSSAAMGDEIAIGEPVSAQPQIKAAGADHDRLRARLRS
jgi:cytoskeletal protein CcmA (bactofilin family)